MSSMAFMKSVADKMRFVPVPGSLNMLTIESANPDEAFGEVADLSEADWDKFESDINEAFEQTP